MTPLPRPSAATTLLAALVLLLAPGVSAAPVGDPLPGLPDGVDYDPAIPTPEEVLGWTPGTWHVRPEQITRYFEALAAASDRVRLEVYGHTHEQRPLLLATISTPENLARVEELRAAHVDAARSGERADDAPLVVWMGYSVHGNEPSGANASLVVAYHLAAARDPALEETLSRTVVLMDPVINPDGLGRFAHWANTYKGKQLVAEGWHKEHTEAWPYGRTNHYWFDLNRDWLLLTHPESRGRIAAYHRWKPHLLTDHHEMGTNRTFFFQPGVPSRQNPRTPAANLELTRALAGHHAAALDAAGELYYSEEGFDDFYYGKGSTYPDVQGSVGVLFEQASSRGHLQENAWGPLAFPDTIANQVRTSFSSLFGADALRDRFLALRSDATRTALDEAAADDVAAWVFGVPRDRARVDALADLLRRHDIAVHALARAVEVDGVRYEPGEAYVVPVRQPQYRLLSSLFETRTAFEDDTFYDVSTWVMPMAFGLDHGGVPRASFDAGLLGERVTDEPRAAGAIDVDRPDGVVAYAFEWHGLHAPRALARLHAADVTCQVATRPFTGVTVNGAHGFDEGTVVVPVGAQDMEPAALHALLAGVAADDGLHVRALSTGLTPGGLDLGSPDMEPLSAPRPVLLVGSGVSSYDAGEVWHELDVRWGQPVAMIDAEDFGRLDLDDVTHVLLVGGGEQLDDDELDDLRDWVRGGGVLVASGDAAHWAGRAVLRIEGGSGGGRSGRRDSDPEAPGPGPDDDVATADTEDDGEEPPRSPAYADYEADRAKTLVSGTIFETRLDLTHPLAWGFVRDRLPVFRTGTRTLDRSDDPYADALVYTDAPRLSGYANDENIERIAGTTAATASRLGRGTVVRIVDDVLFRGYWRGASKVYANALYFGGAVKSTRRVGEDASSGAEEAAGH